MPSLGALLFLTFLAASVSSDTLFVISGYISCTLRSSFKYNMRVIEDDWPIGHEVLFTSGVQSVTYPYLFYNVTTQDSIDFPTLKYEIGLRILHNCNSAHHANAKLDIHVGSYPITHGTHYITYNIDLADKGKPYEYKLEYWPLME